jgi:hypothetical protein
MAREKIQTLSSEALLKWYAQAMAERGRHTTVIGVSRWSNEEIFAFEDEILRRMKAGNEGK